MEKSINNLVYRLKKIFFGCVDENPARHDESRCNPLNEWEMHCRAYNSQRRCAHLKGGRRDWGVVRFRRDYAVSMHTFIDGSQRIRCLLGCGWEVWNKQEWSLKWQVGLNMVNRSTNWPTSSEVPVFTTVSGPVDPRPKDKIESSLSIYKSYKTGQLRILGEDESPIRGRK